MQVAIPHDLTPQEVHNRLAANIDKIPDYVPAGKAEVTTQWVSPDRLTFNVQTLGQSIDGSIEIEPHQVVISGDLPPGLGLFKGMISSTIRDQGAKLLAPQPAAQS